MRLGAAADLSVTHPTRVALSHGTAVSVLAVVGGLMSILAVAVITILRIALLSGGVCVRRNRMTR